MHENLRRKDLLCMRYYNTQNAQIPQRQDGHNICAIIKTMCPPGYRHNGFVETNALGHMMYNSTILVPMKQRVFNKLSKVHNISDHKWSTRHWLLKFPKNKTDVIYMQPWKQFLLLVVTTITLCQLMHLGRWCTWCTHCSYQWTKDCSTS